MKDLIYTRNFSQKFSHTNKTIQFISDKDIFIAVFNVTAVYTVFEIVLETVIDILKNIR